MFSTNSIIKKVWYLPNVTLLLSLICSVELSPVNAQVGISFSKEVAPLTVDLLNQLDSPSEQTRMAAVEVLEKIASEEAIRLLINASLDESPGVRWRSERALEKIGTLAVKPLLAALQSEQLQIRQLAASVLGQIGAQEAVTSLVFALNNDVDAEVRWRAASALGKIGSDSAVEPLVKSLQYPLYSVRVAAARALGEIGSEEALEPLIQLLRNSVRGEQEAVIDALGEIASEAALTPLIGIFNDLGSLNRDTAVRALGKIGSQKAVPFLVEALKDSDLDVRRSVASALGQLNATEAIPLLIEVLQKDTDPNLVQNASISLGKIGAEEAIYSLTELLRDDNSSVSWAAASALGDIGAAAIIPLVRILQNELEESAIRIKAAAALGKIGSEEVVSPLLTALEGSDSNVSSAAGDALARVGQTAIAPLLLALQNSKSDWYATNALGKMGEIAVTPLISVLQHSDVETRRNATNALGKIRSQVAVDPLISSLQDPAPSVRAGSARALGKIGSQAAVKPLIDSLQDPAASVRENSASALGNIGSALAISSLLTALQDPEPAVRGNAANALGKVGSDIEIDPLISLLQDVELVNRLDGYSRTELQVRDTAALALKEIGNVAISRLVENLKNKDNRNSAVWALGKLRVAAATSNLIDALQDSDLEFRANAATALGEIGDVAVAPLVAALKDTKDGEIQKNITDALMGTLRNSREPSSRRFSMQSLKWNRTPEVTSMLLKQLVSSREEVSNRYIAFDGLTLRHHLQNLAQSQNSLETLAKIALEEKEDRFIRYGAILLLVSINTPEALELLDSNETKFLSIIEENYSRDLPFYLPPSLSSEPIDSPSPFENSDLIASIPPGWDRNSIFAPPPNLRTPAIPQGARPKGVRSVTTARAAGIPLVCQFAWVKKRLSDCKVTLREEQQG